MSFFFNRGRNRTNAAELARQTYDLLARLDVANNPNPKVGRPAWFQIMDTDNDTYEQLLTTAALYRLTRRCLNASPR